MKLDYLINESRRHNIYFFIKYLLMQKYFTLFLLCVDNFFDFGWAYTSHRRLAIVLTYKNLLLGARNILKR